MEHDIVVNPGTLAELEVCDHPWCAAPYEYHGESICGLGCTKFSAALIERHPTLFAAVGKLSDSTHEPWHWCRLDAWTGALLRKVATRCEAHGPVGHLRPRASHESCRPHLTGERDPSHPERCRCVGCRWR